MKKTLLDINNLKLSFFTPAGEVDASKFGWSKDAREAMKSRFTQQPVEVPPAPKPRPDITIEIVDTGYDSTVFTPDYKFKAKVRVSVVKGDNWDLYAKKTEIPVDFAYYRNGTKIKLTPKYINSQGLKNAPQEVEFEWSANYKENVMFGAYVNAVDGNGNLALEESVWTNNYDEEGTLEMPEPPPIPLGFYFYTVDNNKTVVNGAIIVDASSMKFSRRN